MTPLFRFDGNLTRLVTPYAGDGGMHRNRFADSGEWVPKRGGTFAATTKNSVTLKGSNCATMRAPLKPRNETEQRALRKTVADVKRGVTAIEAMVRCMRFWAKDDPMAMPEPFGGIE